MRYDQIAKKYHVAKIHDPEQFYPNSFAIEPDGHRLLLVAVVKRHVKKRFRIVGILKAPKTTHT